jgi:hypothetical protein
VDRDLRTRTHGMKKHGKNTKDGTEPKLCVGTCSQQQEGQQRVNSGDNRVTCSGAIALLI